MEFIRCHFSSNNSTAIEKVASQIHQEPWQIGLGMLPFGLAMLIASPFLILHELSYRTKRHNISAVLVLPTAIYLTASGVFITPVTMTAYLAYGIWDQAFFARPA